MMRVIATCGGLGYVSSMPGTIASGVAAASCWVLRTSGVSGTGVSLLTAGLLFAGLWASAGMIHELQESDPSCVVIDEWVAVWGLCAGLPVTPAYYISAFLLFRVFDILKPWPVSYAETLPGVWGVMADDLVAALMSGALIWGALSYIL